MKCVICKSGETRAGTETVTLTRGEAVIVVRDVPADVCEQCGETYVSGAVADAVLKQASAAIDGGARMLVSAYVAA